MAKNKVLFIDSAHPILQEFFESKGFETDYFSDYNRADFLACIHIYTGVIIRSRIKFDNEIIDKAMNLRFIGRVGAGMENINTTYAEQKGIACFNSPEGNRDAVGEHTLAMLLALFNRILIADKQVRQGIRLREENRGIEIKGKTIAIIGYGNMGSAFAQRLSGFRCNVIAYDKYKQNYSDDFVKETDMNEIFENADVVSLHVPLTEETRYMVNDSYLSRFKKNIWLINTSRGKVVKTDDLVKYMKTGNIIGTALDVIEYEGISFENIETDIIPESYRYLISSDKAILTPHIAGWTEESKIKLSQVLADKISAWLNSNEL